MLLLNEIFCRLRRLCGQAGHGVSGRLGAWIGILIAACVTLGCNHLFYYPDHKVHARPDKFGLIYSEHTLVEADGTRLKVWHLLPGGRPRRATILQLHGNAENMTTHFFFVGWLAAAGFDVVTFDYRGYGKSTGVPDRQGLLADAATVIDWIKHQPVLRDDPLVVFGQSLGGAVAVPLSPVWHPARCRLSCSNRRSTPTGISPAPNGGYLVNLAVASPIVLFSVRC